MALVAVAAATRCDEVGEAIDPNQGPRQHMVYGIVVAERRVAVEASRAEGIFEGVADRSQGNPFTAEEVASDVGNVIVQVSIGPSDILHPHDFHRRFEKPGKPRETGRDTRHQHNDVIVSTQGSSRDVIV